MSRQCKVWTDAMKNSVSDNRVFLVDNMTSIEGIMDHLVVGKVFPDSEDVLCTNKRKDQVRNLLDRLQKRTQRDYWIFVSCLYKDSVRQGNIADEILGSYQRYGGTIPEEILRLQRDYYERHGQDEQMLGPARLDHPTAGISSVEQIPPPQPLEFHQLSPSTSNQPVLPSSRHHQQLSQSGSFIAMETLCPAQYQPPEQMDTDSGDGRLPGASPQEAGLMAAAAAGDESIYSRARRENTDKVYKMDSCPRGLALIINNEHFQHMDRRYGTKHDKQLLSNMLNTLGFDVTEKEDRTAQEMLEDLQSLSEDPRLAEVDSCIVAILSHGSEGGVIYGTDGRDGTDTLTYITVMRMRCIFSSSSCPNLSKKPKLFILQSCRGVYEDTREGVVPLRRDIVIEGGRPADQRESVFWDMAFMYSTIEGMVGYRNTFIPKLVEVFTKNAATKSFSGMKTELNREMGSITIEGDIYFTPDQSENMRKEWYFNPPPR
ncbi:cell death protein 3-like isoform X2 [Babylonia areolata]|uniref:cell death protein 3-like isoform X2 n=1 Tax=Babylonia areolata TaxID=304850 RepID=UPI003FD603A4